MKSDLTPIELHSEATDDFVAAHFFSLALKRELHFFKNNDWPTEVAEFTLGTAVVKITGESWNRTLAELDDCLIYASLNDGRAYFQIAAVDEEVAAKLMEHLRGEFPRTEATDDTVPITFWSWSPRGAFTVSRSLEVPPWAGIADNYTGEVSEQLGAMMDGSFRPSIGGQLILWMGPPGTGKTWALRSLAWEWREWAEFHYIVDPENFFGEHSDYMLSVIVNNYAGNDAWKVLILEDTGELLATDAKQQTGQALSRLLNVVDGIIGQGLRVLCLVTTNDEIKALHPAVARPGRCAAKVEFAPLSTEEAEQWLRDRGIDAAPDERSLADLFAIESGYTNKRAKKLVGFGS